MTAPKWAQNLLLNALIAENCEDVPQLTWYHSRHFYSSGSWHFPPAHIHITAGENRTDAKLTLLHEIAHHLALDQHHNDKFWDIAWRLYRYFKLPIRYCKEFEGDYRKGALVAYKRSKKEEK